jgi:hypothetical protein
MINVQLYSNEIGQDGELSEQLAVAFAVVGQDVLGIRGNPRYIQLGIPVYSEQYGRLIDFDTDGEEWARNLASAYRNGAVSAVAEEFHVGQEEHRALFDTSSAAAATQSWQNSTSA